MDTVNIVCLCDQYGSSFKPLFVKDLTNVWCLTNYIASK